MQTKQILKFLLIGLLSLLVATSCLASNQYLPFDPNNTFELSLNDKPDPTSGDQDFDTILNSVIYYQYIDKKAQENTAFVQIKQSSTPVNSHSIRAPPLAS